MSSSPQVVQPGLEVATPKGDFVKYSNITAAMSPEQERAYNESLNTTGYEHGAYNQSQGQFKGNGGYAAEQPGMEVIEKREKRTICGLATTTFALLVALILVILAAGIGGGVGGTMAVNNAKNSAKRYGIGTSKTKL